MCDLRALLAPARDEGIRGLGARQRQAEHVPVARLTEYAHHAAQRTRRCRGALALEKRAEYAYRGKQSAHADAQLVQVLGIAAARHAGRIRRDLRKRGVAKRGECIVHRRVIGKQRARPLGRRRGRRRVHRRMMGWPMGLEPTTTGITTLDSTFELRPPLQLACPAGLEPTTPSLEGWCSIRLSYGQPGKKTKNLVGVRGFEPPTSCSQSKRATRLRHTPKMAANDTLSASSGQRRLLATGGVFCYKSASLF